MKFYMTLFYLVSKLVHCHVFELHDIFPTTIVSSHRQRYIVNEVARLNPSPAPLQFLTNGPATEKIRVVQKYSNRCCCGELLVFWNCRNVCSHQ